MTTTGGFVDAGGLRRMPASFLPSYGISTRSPGGRRCGSASLRQSIAFMCAAFICARSCTNRNDAEMIIDAGALQAFAGGERVPAR